MTISAPAESPTDPCALLKPPAAAAGVAPDVPRLPADLPRQEQIEGRKGTFLPWPLDCATGRMLRSLQLQPAACQATIDAIRQADRDAFNKQLDVRVAEEVRDRLREVASPSGPSWRTAAAVGAVTLAVGFVAGAVAISRVDRN